MIMKAVKSILIVSCILFLSCYPVHSQNVVAGSDDLLFKLRLNKGINGIENATYSSIVGNPYIFRDFRKGKLIVNSGEEFNVNIRYDIYAAEMHLKDNNQIYAIIHPETVKLIETDSLKFIYSGYVKSLKRPADNTPDESTYFIEKTDGKCKLLVMKNMRIQDSEPAKLYQDAKPAKFILTNDTYYLKLEGKNAVRIRKMSELLSLLSDHKETLKKFISSNKLGIKDLEDLVRIVSYYNNL
jgi:hypothetical protein